MAFNSFDIFDEKTNRNIAYDSNVITSINGEHMDKILAANLIFPRKNIEWYTKFNRFGCIDPLNGNSENREFLFFTKPDLNIFSNSDYSSLSLQKTDTWNLNDYPIFVDGLERYKDALTQLQYSVKDSTGINNPFMCLLSNAVTSNLDMPSISAESNESSMNIYGNSIQYRSHSLKSDNGFDFNLSFTDTSFLEIYHLVKLYDEYMRLVKVGKISHKKEHIVNRILPEQFSIYKFVVGNDGETILFFAKITGVFFTDVPRNDFGDTPQDGIKYSLSFHGQWVEDSDPTILVDFNKVTPGSTSSYQSAWNNDLSIVNNDWISYPIITKESSHIRSSINLGYNYKLKWTNLSKNNDKGVTI